MNTVNGYYNQCACWYGYSIDTCFFLARTEYPDGTLENVIGKEKSSKYKDRGWES